MLLKTVSHSTKKICLLLLVILACTANTVAQDVITMKNGDEITCKVIEIGVREVKYKKIDFQDGPTYSIKKSDVFMIHYANGKKEVLNALATTRTSQPASDPFKNFKLDSSTSNYTFGKPIKPNGDEKEPLLSGVLSLIIPGAGQFFNEDYQAAAIFLGATIVNGVLLISTRSPEIFVLTDLAIRVLATINAYKIAGRVNLVRGYQIGENTYINIQPSVTNQNYLLGNNQLAYGVSVKVSF